MNAQTIAITLVKLFAVGLLIYAFGNASMMLFLLSDAGRDLVSFYMVFAAVGLPVLAAILLWLVPESFIGPARSGAGQEDLSENRLFGTGVALIGVYLVISAIAAVLDRFVRLTQQKQVLGEFYFAPEAGFADLYSDLFLLVAGLLLFFGHAGLTRVFVYLRGYGLKS
jgi:hypothetical protein